MEWSNEVKQTVWFSRTGRREEGRERRGEERKAKDAMCYTQIDLYTSHGQVYGFLRTYVQEVGKETLHTNTITLSYPPLSYESWVSLRTLLSTCCYNRFLVLAFPVLGEHIPLGFPGARTLFKCGCHDLQPLPVTQSDLRVSYSDILTVTRGRILATLSHSLTHSHHSSLPLSFTHSPLTTFVSSSLLHFITHSLDSLLVR